jgi:hypothetical protein
LTTEAVVWWIHTTKTRSKESIFSVGRILFQF